MRIYCDTNVYISGPFTVAVRPTGLPRIGQSYKACQAFCLTRNRHRRLPLPRNRTSDYRCPQANTGKAPAEKIYCGTNVYISYFLDEISKGRVPIPYGYHAERLFKEVMSGKHYLLFSKLVLLEIKLTYPYLLESMEDKILEFRKADSISVYDVDTKLMQESHVLDRELGIGWKDCYHMSFAKQEGAVFITWETKHKEIGERLGINVLTPYDV